MKHENTISIKTIYTIKGAELYYVFYVSPIRGWDTTTTRKIGEIRVAGGVVAAHYWTANGACRHRFYETLEDAVEYFEHCDAERLAANWYNAK